MGCFKLDILENLESKLTVISKNSTSEKVRIVNFLTTKKGVEDYYPFGMLMPNRNGGENYTFGYQGSEKDDEVKGGGNSYTTHFRQLDPRLGKWLSIDPKASSLPWQSPYCSMDNSPIWHNDVLGDKVGGLRKLKRKDKRAYNSLMSDFMKETGLQLKTNIFGKLKYKGNNASYGKHSSTARTFLKEAIDSKSKVTIKIGDITKYVASTEIEGDGTIFINPEQVRTLMTNLSPRLNKSTVGFGLVTFHEMHHWKFNSNDLSNNPKANVSLLSTDPGPAVSFVNEIRKDLDASGASGSSYGKRTAYYIKRGNKAYIPFSWNSRAFLMSGDEKRVKSAITKKTYLTINSPSIDFILSRDFKANPIP